MTSWPFTPTTILASSRRLSGSTRSNDKRTSMEHLDGTLFSFERPKTQRSITFRKVSGYARVSSSLASCLGPSAPQFLSWKRHRGLSSEALRKPCHRNRAANGPVRPSAKHLWFGARPIEREPGKGQE